MVRAPCCDKNGQKKGPWTAEEDQKLIDYIEKNGHGSWRTLPKNAGLARCGKSCRLRWTNYLRPDIKRGRFTFEEEETIIQLHSILGNKWSAIAARLPGRTDNEIKNYWNTHIRKRLLRMGIDPVTHSPRLNLLDLTSLLYDRNQLDISMLLGINPLINSELVRLASTLLSPPQSFPINTQLLQNSLSSLQDNQLQNPVQEIQAGCTISNDRLINEAKRMQLQLDNLNIFNQSDLCSQNLDNIYTENSNNFVDPTCNQSLNLMTSVVSTSTSSSMSHLNSPSLCTENETESFCRSHLNSPSLCTENETESFCRDLFQFQIPDLLDVTDFL